MAKIVDMYDVIPHSLQEPSSAMIRHPFYDSARLSVYRCIMAAESQPWLRVDNKGAQIYQHRWLAHHSCLHVAKIATAEDRSLGRLGSS